MKTKNIYLLLLISFFIFTTCDEETPEPDSYRIKKKTLYLNDSPTWMLKYMYEDNKISSELTYWYRNENWTELSKKEYTYSDNEEIILTSKKTNEEWVYSNKTIYKIQDEKVNEIQNFAYDNNEWIDNYLKIYNYQNSQLISFFAYVYENKVPELSYFFEYKYDEKKLIEKIEFTCSDSIKDTCAPLIKTEYIYTENLLSKNILYEKSDSSWIKICENLFSYNTDNELIKFEHYLCNNDECTFDFETIYTSPESLYPEEQIIGTLKAVNKWEPGYSDPTHSSSFPEYKIELLFYPNEIDE